MGISYIYTTENELFAWLLWMTEKSPIIYEGVFASLGGQPETSGRRDPSICLSSNVFVRQKGALSLVSSGQLGQ